MSRYLLPVFALMFSQLSIALEPDKLFEKLSPSVWVVWVQGIEAGKMTEGSSVVIGHEELITNCHVLKGGKSVSIKRENTFHNARLVHADVDRDLCIIQAPGLAAPAVEIAPLKSVKVGQRVYAIGAPRNLELTLSDGLVSAFIKDKEDKVTDIQISVPVSPGSSGGGLFNSEGKLIGIPTWGRLDGQNLNFARPAEWIGEVPERSRVALAEFASRATQEKKKPEAGREQKGPPGRQLLGEDLRTHFVSLGSIAGTTPSGASIRLNINVDGTMDIRNVDKGGFTTGSYEVRDSDNQICFVVNAQRWKMMQVCYRLYETEPKKYVMRSTSDNYYFSYSEQ